MERVRAETAVLASVVLASSLFVAACGEGGGAEQSRPATQAERAQEANEEDANRRDEEPGENDKDGRSGQSSSNSVVQSSQSGSTSSSSSQSTSSGRGVKTFTGTGSTTLTFNVEEPARLAWTNSKGKAFTAKGSDISIDSRAGRGEVPLEAGTYDGVKVSGSNWTIVVRPP